MRREYYFYFFVTGACIQLIVAGNVLFHNLLGGTHTNNESFAISLFVLVLATPLSLLLMNIGNHGLNAFSPRSLNLTALIFTATSVAIGLIF